MKKVAALATLVLMLSTLSASAILMQKQKFDLLGYCGDAIQRYCPRVDIDNFHALWACLSPHFMQINPMCKATLQDIQGN